VRPEGLGQFKNPLHRDFNPRLSGLQHSALTTTLSVALLSKKKMKTLPDKALKFMSLTDVDIWISFSLDMLALDSISY
jgi:hypothetical protein